MSWLELPQNERLNVLNEISVRTGFQPFIIEKDWWVVQTLRVISQMDVVEHLVFKGGTSLSKAWNLIDRFSEDVDLAINREFFGFSGDLSKKQITKLRTASNLYLSDDFRLALQKKFDDIGINGVEFSVIGREDVSDEDPVKIEVRYPFITDYSEYVKPSVLLEIGSRSLIEPATTRSFRSIIGEHFSEQTFADSDVHFRCVNPERTFLEKLFLLHEEHQRPTEKMLITGRSRHFYDIFQIAKTPFAEKAIADKELYKSIVAHRERFSKMKGVDYASHFPPNLNPIPPAELISEWQDDYEKVRGQMVVVGKAPEFEELIAEIERLCQRINSEPI